MFLQRRGPEGPEIAIIGGSLVGPMTGLLLKRAGFKNVRIYEAAKEGRAQAGGLIGLESSAYEALNRVGIPLKQVAAGRSSNVMVYGMRRGKPATEAITTAFDGINTTWDVFNRAVCRRSSIEYGKRLVSLSDQNDKALLTFSDRTTATADVVIFADGRKSIGRSLLDPERRLEYQGYMIWRGISDSRTNLPAHFSRFQDPENGVLFALSEPISQGVNKGRSDWAFYQNLSYDDFVALTGKKPNEKPFIFPHEITPQMRSYLNRHVREFLPKELADIIDFTREITLVPINDIPVPQQAVYSIGRRAKGVLLGDALMCVRPHTARGLNNGLEQGFNLAEHLAQGGIDALKGWEQRLLPTLQHWIQLGRSRAQEFGLGQQAQLQPVTL